MKKLYYLLGTLLLTAALAACSSEYDDPPEPWGSHQSEISTSNSDDILMNFRLLNIHGDTATLFAGNDNIVFDLVIENKSKKDFVYSRNFEGKSNLVLDDDFFCVYTEKGERIGSPWTGMFCDFTLQKKWVIPAGTTYHIRCPWKWSPNIRTTHPLCKDDNDNKKLSKGIYYTNFSVKYDNILGDKDNKIIKKFNTQFIIK